MPPRKNIDDQFYIDEHGELRAKKAAPRRRDPEESAGCSNLACGKSDVLKNFKRCVQCRGVLYCSRECQKIDWPSHKVVCNDTTPDLVAFGKIMRKLGSNPGLIQYFELLAILKHSLHLLDEEGLKQYQTKPVVLNLRIQYEPANIKNFFRLYDVAAAGNTTIMTAIPQILDVEAPSDEEVARPGVYYMQAFRRAKEELAKLDMKESGYTRHPVILLLRCEQVIMRPYVEGSQVKGREYAGFSEHLRTFAMTEMGRHIARRRHETSLDVPIRAGSVDSQPMAVTLHNLVECINGEIRDDTSNKMRLRIKLPEFDRNLITLTSIKRPITQFLHPKKAKMVNLLRQKIAREYVYHVAAEHYGYKKTALPEPAFEGHLDRSASKARGPGLFGLSRAFLALNPLDMPSELQMHIKGVDWSNGHMQVRVTRKADSEDTDGPLQVARR